MIKVTKSGRLINPRGADGLKREVRDSLKDTLEELNREDAVRARAGKDIRGQFFKGYTDQYRRFGRRARGLQEHPVNLTFTGRLLDTIEGTVSIAGNTVRLVRRIAASQLDKAKGIMKKREFFGHSKRADEILTRALNDLDIKAALK